MTLQFSMASVVIFFTLCLTSYGAPYAAQIVVGGLLGLAALAFPRTGMFLLFAVIPFQQVFNFVTGEMQRFGAVLIVCLILRHVFTLRTIRTLKPPPAIIILVLFFSALVVARAFYDYGFSLALSGRHLKEVALIATLPFISLIALRYGAERGFRHGLLVAAIASLSISIVVDALAIYIPGFAIIADFGKPYELRLSGVHLNPNATAKFLALGVVVALICFAEMSGRRKWLAALALAVFATATAACLSKNVLLGVVLASGAFTVTRLWQRDWPRLRAVSIGIAIILGMGYLWIGWLAPPLLENGQQRWLEFAKVTAGPRMAPTPHSALEALRVGQSFRMEMAPAKNTAPEASAPPVKGAKNTAKSDPSNTDTSEVDNSYKLHPKNMYTEFEGEVTYTKRDCKSIWCTGQRDIVWGGALTIIKEHYLLGIGHGNWPDYYQKEVNFPFDSPHNGLLDLWGGYGLVGLAIYLAFVWMLMTAVLRSVHPQQINADPVYAISSSVFLFLILLTELFDPPKFLAASPHTIWLWVLLAAQLRHMSSLTAAAAPEAKG